MVVQAGIPSWLSNVIAKQARPAPRAKLAHAPVKPAKPTKLSTIERTTPDVPAKTIQPPIVTRLISKPVPITATEWNLMPVAQRVKLCQSLGLEGKVGGKSYSQLLPEEALRLVQSRNHRFGLPCSACGRPSVLGTTKRGKFYCSGCARNA